MHHVEHVDTPHGKLTVHLAECWNCHTKVQADDVIGKWYKINHVMQVGERSVFGVTTNDQLIGQEFCSYKCIAEAALKADKGGS